MTHSDDDGLVLPPRLAPKHVVLLPIYRSDEDKAAVLEYVAKLKADLERQRFDDAPIRVFVDDRDLRGGEKNWQHVKKGVPLRVEVGPKDIAKDAVFVARRDTGEKVSMARGEFVSGIASLLTSMQQNLFDRAKKLREENTRTIDNLDEFKKFFTPKKEEIHGGFALCHFVDTPEVQNQLKEMKVTIRCVPIASNDEPGKCIFTGQPSSKRGVFAKAY
jgi:prolyl-tRNA synthetase